MLSNQIVRGERGKISNSFDSEGAQTRVICASGHVIVKAISVIGNRQQDVDSTDVSFTLFNIRKIYKQIENFIQIKQQRSFMYIQKINFPSS